jgi:heme oxygenase
MRIDQIRTALAPIHDAIEKTAMAKSMIGGTVDRDEYTSAMYQMGVIHGNLETLLEQTGQSIYQAATMARATIIANDLSKLGFHGDIKSHDSTIKIVDKFHNWAAQSPIKLIGALYVLEGSRMGSMALVRPISKALNVEVRPGNGVDYHLDGMASRPQVWGKFKADLSSLNLSEEQVSDICSAAVETMQSLFDIYSGNAGTETAKVEPALSA